ncbi:MAG: DUF3990 domain-containing protein [Coriobacteriia bacterium]|nr:DUF3990 domain-containing protein [Coriobacteriia bacterium]
MTRLILYHGSDRIVEKPRFGVGNPRNDYGLGFYCTASLEMACEWAVGRGTDGYANKYVFDDSGLTVVDFESVGLCTLHWLTTLLANRTFDVRAPLALEAREYLLEHFYVDLDDADVVKGFRANDSYFTFAQDFIMGTISYRQLNNAMRLGDLGQQTVIKSARAFERLEFREAREVPRSVWLPRREERDRTARRKYFDVERSKRRRGDLYITQILDEEMRPGDACL